MNKDLAVSIRGIAPLLMHRYAGETPSATKPPRGKKTQEHIDAGRRQKWLSAAYFANDTFHIPPEVVEAMLSNGARKSRKGNDFKQYVGVVEDFIPLIVYSGPEDKTGHQLTGTLEDFFIPEHIDIRGVSVQKSRIDACRPIFRNWGLHFSVRYDPKTITKDDILSALDGSAIGDYRPRFGRFMVESAK